MKKLSIKAATLMLATIFILTLVFCSGCSSDSTEELVQIEEAQTIEEDIIDDRFKEIGSCELEYNCFITVYYDTVTKIVYQFSDGQMGIGGATVVLSDDGVTPARYNEETKTIE